MLKTILKVIGVIIGILALFIGILLFCSWAVQWLWNSFVPDIFGLVELTYGQAMSLFILCSFLFGKYNYVKK